jgi:activator of 2-hydroxyglutaryl-CoA dehydratase
MRRVQLEPEYTLVGGILRFESMGDLLRKRLGAAVNLPPEDVVQSVAALGAAVLGQRRLKQLGQSLNQPACDVGQGMTP